MKIYDIAVVGSGGGTYITDMAMKTGHKVCLIEGTRWGGTCLNRGCIPTKIMVHAADLIRMTQKASDVAVSGEAMKIDWPALKRRVFEKIAESDSLVEYYAPYENIDLLHGFASFVGKVDYEGHAYFKLLITTATDEEEILAEKVVLANGGRTNIPREVNASSVSIMTSESLFHIETWPETLPESMIIIGGGDIGVEFAHIFQSFGVDCTIVQRNKRLVPKQDHEISERITSILRNNGIKIYLNSLIDEVREENNKKILTLLDREEGKKTRLEADSLFVCPGIISNADTLNLENIGLELDERMWIPTNAYLETSVDGVYAMGDINGKPQLRHKSNYEGQILAYNLMSSEVKSREDYRHADYEVVPSGTFTAMQIARVGITEEEAIAQGIKHKVGYLKYSSTAQAYARGILPEQEEIDGFAKVIVDESTHEILGVHILADEASSLIEPYTYLMAIGRQDRYPVNRYENVVENMTVHPALSEVVAWAFESWRKEDKQDA